MVASVSSSFVGKCQDRGASGTSRRWIGGVLGHGARFISEFGAEFG